MADSAKYANSDSFRNVLENYVCNDYLCQKLCQHNLSNPKCTKEWHITFLICDTSCSHSIEIGAATLRCKSNAEITVKLAQLDKSRSAKREAARSHPGRTNTQSL